MVTTWVQSLVGESKSHKPHSMAKKKKDFSYVKLVGSRWILGQLPMLNHKTEGSDDIEVMLRKRPGFGQEAGGNKPQRLAKEVAQKFSSRIIGTTLKPGV